MFQFRDRRRLLKACYSRRLNTRSHSLYNIYIYITYCIRVRRIIYYSGGNNIWVTERIVTIRAPFWKSVRDDHSKVSNDVYLRTVVGRLLKILHAIILYVHRHWRVWQFVVSKTRVSFTCTYVYIDMFDVLINSQKIETRT